MSTPEYIALLLGAVNFLGGIVVNYLRGTIAELKEKVEKLESAHHTSNVAVARDYVTRTEMQQIVNRLMDKLDEIQRDVKEIRR